MSEPPHPGRAIWCLSALITAGLSVSWWVLYFTDYFPVVLGLLGLGGFFAWIAFLINILTGERKQQLQLYFDAAVLQRLRTIYALIGMLLVGWIGIAPMFGTLIVDSLEPTAGHVVEVWSYAEGQRFSQKPVRRMAVPPNSKAKILLSTAWFGAKPYYVKITGLPGQKVEIQGLGRNVLLVPDMLLERAVILARPAAKFAGPVTAGYAAQVLINGDVVKTIVDYEGQSIWINADDDVEIPKRLTAQWREEFLRSQLDPELMYRWNRPLAVAPRLELEADTVVTVRLVLRAQALEDDPTVRYENSLTIASSGKPRRFPEQLVLQEISQ